MAASNTELSIQREIAKRVVFFRTKQGMSQAALGAACGCSFQQIQKYESGKNRISACRLKVIADFLNVPISAFYEGRVTATELPLSPKHVALAHALVAIEMRVAPKHRTLCNLIFAIAEAEFSTVEDAVIEP